MLTTITTPYHQCLFAEARCLHQELNRRYYQEACREQSICLTI